MEANFTYQISKFIREEGITSSSNLVNGNILDETQMISLLGHPQAPFSLNMLQLEKKISTELNLFRALSEGIHFFI